MQKLLVSMFALFAPLFADMSPRHFHLDMTEQEGEWVCTKNEMKRGRYYEIWSRSDLPQGVVAENICIVSSPTRHGERPDMRRMMRLTLSPIRYMPGTRTHVHREAPNEAVFEWSKPGGHQAVVRMLIEPEIGRAHV